MTTLMRRQTAIAYEKATRLTPDHPRRRLLNSPVRHRLVRPSWGSAAESLIKEVPRTLASREPLPDQLDCPWASKGSWEVYPEGAAPQQANTANLSLQLIRETRAHVTIYTDGSATGGTTAGGADMVTTTGDPADPVIIHTSKARGAELTSSYEEEKAALLLALD